MPTPLRSGIHLKLDKDCPLWVDNGQLRVKAAKEVLTPEIVQVLLGEPLPLQPVEGEAVPHPGGEVVEDALDVVGEAGAVVGKLAAEYGITISMEKMPAEAAPYYGP